MGRVDFRRIRVIQIYGGGGRKKRGESVYSCSESGGERWRGKLRARIHGIGAQ